MCVLFTNNVADIDAIKGIATKVTEYLLANELDKAAAYATSDCRRVAPGGPIKGGNEGMTL